MDELIAFLRVGHIIGAILMAWPIYGLVAVNQRARLGPPLGDRTDLYLENILRNRTVPCLIFQATVLISGLGLVLLRGLGLNELVTNPALGLKFVLLLIIIGLLSYVHFNLQPQIDALFAQARSPLPTEVVPKVGALRLRRKRLATVCMFVVLTAAMLGVQVWASFPVWLTLSLVIAITAFTLRAYKTVTPFGWV